MRRLEILAAAQQVKEADGLTEQAFTFGPFRLLPAQRVLLEDGEPLRLGSRALDILLVLAESAGTVVSKDELVARVWPDTHVEEGNLRVHISALRKALGEGRGAARYVENIPGRGYTFVAPVERSTQSQAAVVPAARASGNGLPARLTRTIGRSETVETIVEQLSQRRFVTVVGPGGIGKTTVAIAAAERAPTYDDGIRFLDLAPLADAALVASALAGLLGLSVLAETATASLTEFLRHKRMLIVLDNCERVIEAAAILAEELLRNAPGVHVLATSREAMRAEGEWVHRLAPLELPPSSAAPTLDAAMCFPAVQLFVERAAAGGDGFRAGDTEAPLLVEVCRRLDGIPLAIELAAGRVDQFGLRGLAGLLDDRFQQLFKGRRTALPRHQTLQATLDWSYDTLSSAEQAVLRRLAVFAGGFTLASACAVVADGADPDALEPLSSLTMKSLVTVDVSGTETRYRLLETTRSYARRKLRESDEMSAFLQRHAAYLCGVFERASVEWEARPAIEWLAAYGPLIDDVRAALDWALSENGDVPTGVTLAAASAPLWYQLSLQDEFRGRAERALSVAVDRPEAAPVREMQLLIALGHSYLNTNGLLAAMPAAFARALDLAQRHGEIGYRMQATWGLWAGLNIAGRYADALLLAEEFAVIGREHPSHALPIVNDRMMMLSRHLVGDHAAGRHHAERVLAHPTSSVAAARNTGFQLDQRVAAGCVVARVLWLQGRPDQAMCAAEEVAQHALSSGHLLSLCYGFSVSSCLVALLTGNIAAAARWTEILRDRAAERSSAYWQCWAHCFEAALDRDGDAEVRSRRLLALKNNAGFGPQHIEILATLDIDLALPDAFERASASRSSWCHAELLRAEGEQLLRRNGDGPGAERRFRQALEVAGRQGELSWELRAATSLARLWSDDGRIREAADLLEPVYGRFDEGFATPDLVRANTLLETMGSLVN